jgi:hypothetical protein
MKYNELRVRVAALERIVRLIPVEQLTEVRRIIGDNTPLGKEMILIINQEFQARNLPDDMY